MGWFGSKRKEVLREVAEIQGGTFVDEGVFRGHRVELLHNELPMFLDSYTQSTGKSAVLFDRVRVAFPAASPMKLKIYKKGLFSSIAKALGAKDLLTGDAAFDEAFIIKGSDDEQVFSLFLDEALLRRMESLPQVRVEIVARDPFTMKKMEDGELLLLLYALDRRRDAKAYGAMLDLARHLLERLTALGMVLPGAPITAMNKPPKKKEPS